MDARHHYHDGPKKPGEQVQSVENAANLLLNTIQQRPVGFAGPCERHHGQQLELLTDDTLLSRKKTRYLTLKFIF